MVRKTNKTKTKTKNYFSNYNINEFKKEKISKKRCKEMGKI